MIVGVVQELIMHLNLSGAKQLFSQGMADLLLDACSDYWDGHDVRPLGDEERFCTPGLCPMKCRKYMHCVH